MSVIIKKWLIRRLSPMPYSIKRVVFWIWCRTTAAGRVANKGERLVVSSWDELIGCGEFYHAIHGHRYVWANEQIQALERKQSRTKVPSILDIGCGSGFGAWYLGTRFSQVFGYDPDPIAINWAKKHFINRKSPLTFGVNIPKTKYDYVVCFEVIEHDFENVYASIDASIRPDSVVLISTANGANQSVRQWLIDNKLTTVNLAHTKEFTPLEFENILKEKFSAVKLFGQCVKGVYNYRDYDKWRRKGGVEISDFEMRPGDFVNCEVIVAVCRNE